MFSKKDGNGLHKPLPSFSKNIGIFFVPLRLDYQLLLKIRAKKIPSRNRLSGFSGKELIVVFNF